MDQTINLQIPIGIDIRNQALETAKSLGFSSLQESIRIFIHQLAQHKLEVSFGPSPIVLSAKNDRRYAKIINNIKSGREKTVGFQNTKDMVKYLDDNSSS